MEADNDTNSNSNKDSYFFNIIIGFNWTIQAMAHNNTDNDTDTEFSKLGSAEFMFVCHIHICERLYVSLYVSYACLCCLQSECTQQVVHHDAKE